MNDKTKWLLNGGIGTLLFGSGLSLALECSHIKHSGDHFWLLGDRSTVGIGLSLNGAVSFI